MSDQPVIFITGASTGIGKATAALFAEKNWRVVATMRRPEAQTEEAPPGVLRLRLDVTDPANICEAVGKAIAEFGRIDVLLNNAGYGAMGPVETASAEKIDRQIATNLTGLIHTTQAALPHLRNSKGTIVNISSVGGRTTFPLMSLYHATKWAVEGLSESLIYELAPHGVRVRIIEPGGVATDFGSRSLDASSTGSTDAYDETIQAFMTGIQTTFGTPPSTGRDVAQAIWDAVHDDSARLRYVVGSDAEAILEGRAAVSFEEFSAGLRQRFGL